MNGSEAPTNYLNNHVVMQPVDDGHVMSLVNNEDLTRTLFTVWFYEDGEMDIVDNNVVRDISVEDLLDLQRFISEVIQASQ